MPSFTQVSQQGGAATCLLRMKAGGVKRRVCSCVQVCLQEDYYQMLHDGRMQMSRDVPDR